MNDHPNGPDNLDNEAALIALMRAALDEVAAGSDVDADPIRPASSDRPRSTSLTTLLGVAAVCTALVGGATWALSQRSPSPFDIAAPAVDVEVPTDASVDPPMTTILGADEPWFSIAAANLAPGAISRPDRPGATNGEQPTLFQSWRVASPGLEGFLFASIFPARPIDGPEVDATSTVEELPDVPDGRAWLVFPTSTTDSFGAPSMWWSRTDGSLWVFDEHGLYSAVSSNTWIDLVLGAQPGSGVPIVLPDAATVVLSVGTASNVVITQLYTATTTGTADLTVTDGATAPWALVDAVVVDPVTIAGTDGWKATFADGHTEVVWQAGGGWWGLLGISAELADQIDGIIASVARADGATIPATPVAPPP